jgi:DNA-binding transcriptional ArsR family regulator
MRRYFEVAVAPYWDTVVARATADRAYRGHAVLEGGLAAMFASLPAGIEWDPPVLRIQNYPVDGDLHLEGRGITLIPSYFCWRSPTALADRDLPPVLVYPARTPLDAAVERTSEPLRALLGGTRAAILKALAMSRTTTELSRQLAIAPGTASHHVTALRSAGLVASQRQANLVLHQLTPLGGALLGQEVTDPEESPTAPSPWQLR